MQSRDHDLCTLLAPIAFYCFQQYPQKRDDAVAEIWDGCLLISDLIHKLRTVEPSIEPYSAYTNARVILLPSQNIMSEFFHTRDVVLLKHVGTGLLCKVYKTKMRALLC